MNETPVRLRVVSRMTEDDGQTHEIKCARRGVLCEQGGGVALEYDDEQDGERARIELWTDAARARMTRRGMTSAVLEFTPGERTSGVYRTHYGEIPVAVRTHTLSLTREETGGLLALDYDVFVGGERTARTHLTAQWRL